MFLTLPWKVYMHMLQSWSFLIHRDLYNFVDSCDFDDEKRIYYIMKVHHPGPYILVTMNCIILVNKTYIHPGHYELYTSYEPYNLITMDCVIITLYVCVL